MLSIQNAINLNDNVNLELFMLCQLHVYKNSLSSSAARCRVIKLYMWHQMIQGGHMKAAVRYDFCD